MFSLSPGKFSWPPPLIYEDALSFALFRGFFLLTEFAETKTSGVPPLSSLILAPRPPFLWGGYFPLVLSRVDPFSHCWSFFQEDQRFHVLFLGQNNLKNCLTLFFTPVSASLLVFSICFEAFVPIDKAESLL